MSRKQEVIDVVLDKIKDGGLNVDFTISELAKSVDIGKSTIYEYFNTKDEIVDEALNQILDDTVKELLSYHLVDNMTFEEAFKGLLDKMFNLGETHSYLMRFIQLEYQEKAPSIIKPKMLEKINSLRDHYEQLFTEIMLIGVNEGVLKINYNMKKAFVIQSIVAGGIMRFLNCKVEVKISSEEAIEAIYEAVLTIAN